MIIYFVFLSCYWHIILPNFIQSTTKLTQTSYSLPALFGHFFGHWLVFHLLDLINLDIMIISSIWFPNGSTYRTLFSRFRRQYFFSKWNIIAICNNPMYLGQFYFHIVLDLFIGKLAHRMLHPSFSQLEKSSSVASKPSFRIFLAKFELFEHM